MSSPSRLPVDANKRSLLEARMAGFLPLRGGDDSLGDASRGNSMGASIFAAANSREPVSAPVPVPSLQEAALGFGRHAGGEYDAGAGDADDALDAEASTDANGLMSGKKRARRKSEHPSRYGSAAPDAPSVHGSSAAGGGGDEEDAAASTGGAGVVARRADGMPHKRRIVGGAEEAGVPVSPAHVASMPATGAGAPVAASSSMAPATSVMSSPPSGRARTNAAGAGGGQEGGLAMSPPLMRSSAASGVAPTTPGGSGGHVMTPATSTAMLLQQHAHLPASPVTSTGTPQGKSSSRAAAAAATAAYTPSGVASSLSHASSAGVGSVVAPSAATMSGAGAAGPSAAKSITSYFQPSTSSASSHNTVMPTGGAALHATAPHGSGDVDVELVSDASRATPPRASVNGVATSHAPAAAAVPAAALQELQRLRAELETKHQLLKGASQTLQSLQAELAASKEDAARARMDSEALKQTAERTSEAARAARVRAAKNLAVLLRDISARDAVVARRELVEKQARIGHIVCERQGSTSYEAWEEGSDFIALRNAEAELRERRADLEKLQKDVARRHKKLRDSTGGAGGAGGEGKPNARGARGRGGGKSPAGSAFNAGAAADTDMLSDEEDGGLDEVDAVTSPLDTGRSLRSVADEYGLGAFMGSTLSLVSSGGGGASASASAATLDLRAQHMAELDLMEVEEALKVNLMSLKREEQLLADRRKALEAEKQLLLLELKKSRALRESRFRDSTILNDRYLLLDVLGKGGFSEVWRAMDLHEVVEVAVKIHQLIPHWSDEKKRNYVKHALREYEIQKTLVHPHLVRLHAVVEIDANAFATVLEYCRGSDAEKLIKSQGSLPEREARAIIIQVLSALRYMNGYSSPWQAEAGSGMEGSTAAAAASMPAPTPPQLKIIHYDLKPANILFDEHRNAKITDFGLSKIVSGDGEGGDMTSMELTSQGAGTYWYLPPECFHTTSSVRISNKVDVWSVGVIFYQMLFGVRPFGEGMTQEQMATRNVMVNEPEKGVTFPAKPAVSTEAKAFIRRCLTAQVHLRPDVLTICEDPYLRMRMKS